jgi:hypothetical protein
MSRIGEAPRSAAARLSVDGAAAAYLVRIRQYRPLAARGRADWNRSFRMAIQRSEFSASISGGRTRAEKPPVSGFSEANLPGTPGIAGM